MRPTSERREAAPAVQRGQTSIDFLVGMAVFLLAVGFVFGFAPGLFEPFAGDTGESMVIVDRGAATLAEGLLVGSAGSPGVLNETCTVEFFDDDGDTHDCRFDTEDLNEAIGIDDATNLNVTIEDDGSVMTLTAGDTATLAAGRAPATHQDVIAAKRIVRLAGTERTLTVRVW